MINIADLLQSRLEAYKNNSLEEKVARDGKEYQKEWAKGVQFFQMAVNKARERDGLQALPFMAIRQKIVGVREISDLRWFYGVCLKYSRKKGKDYTFSRCFFGALDIKKIK